MSEERKPLELNVDYILQNQFLLADYMMVPEYQEKLENASVSDIR